MYVKERLRVYTTWLVGVLIGLTGLLIIIMSIAKVNYTETGSRWLIDLLAAIFSYPALNWIWPWLPDKLLSVQIIIGGLCPFIISLIFTGKAYPSASGNAECCGDVGEFVVEQIANLLTVHGRYDRLSPLLDRVPTAFRRRGCLRSVSYRAALA